MSVCVCRGEDTRVSNKKNVVSGQVKGGPIEVGQVRQDEGQDILG